MSSSCCCYQTHTHKCHCNSNRNSSSCAKLQTRHITWIDLKCHCVPLFEAPSVPASSFFARWSAHSETQWQKRADVQMDQSLGQSKPAGPSVHFFFFFFFLFQRWSLVSEALLNRHNKAVSDRQSAPLPTGHTSFAHFSLSFLAFHFLRLHLVQPINKPCLSVFGEF